MKKITITLLLILSLISTGFANNNVCKNTYKDIVQIVTKLGFTVTATRGGRHNIGSKHYLGKAVDVRSRDKSDAEIKSLEIKMKALGYVFRDERERPVGQAVWSGEHVHIHVPSCDEVPDVFMLPTYEPDVNMCGTETDELSILL